MRGFSKLTRPVKQQPSDRSVGLRRWHGPAGEEGSVCAACVETVQTALPEPRALVALGAGHGDEGATRAACAGAEAHGHETCHIPREMKCGVVRFRAFKAKLDIRFNKAAARASRAVARLVECRLSADATHCALQPAVGGCRWQGALVPPPARGIHSSLWTRRPCCRKRYRGARSLVRPALLMRGEVFA